MHFFSGLLAGLAAVTLGSAQPTELASRDIPSAQLDDFKFWVQYAAASYCHDNYNATAGHQITCWANNCPQVEEDGAEIQLSFSNASITDTAGFIALDHTRSSIVLTFRGSYSVRNWLADANFPFLDSGLCKDCKVEAGFWSSWLAVRPQVEASLKSISAAHPDYNVVVAGHSLGAAVATVAAADLRTKGYKATLYAYASPRVANPALADFITAQGNNYRFSHDDDPVPKLPLLVMGYVHVSPEYFISTKGNATVEAKDVTELQGQVNNKGNTGTGIPLITAFDAHHWYFERADGCKGPGLPLKRDVSV